MQGDSDAVKALLKQAADVNAAQGDGMTALHWAAMKDDAELAQMLLFAGANVRATTRLGAYTPLIWPASTATRPVIEPLLKAGADVEREDGQRHDAADGGGGVRQRRRGEGAASTSGADVNAKEPVRGLRRR